MVGLLNGVFVFYNIFALGKRCVHIAVFVVDLMADVVLHLVVDFAALHGERLLGRLDDGQRFIFDLNKTGGLTGNLLRLGGHHRDDIAIEANLVVANDGDRDNSRRGCSAHPCRYRP